MNKLYQSKMIFPVSFLIQSTQFELQPVISHNANQSLSAIFKNTLGMYIYVWVQPTYRQVIFDMMSFSCRSRPKNRDTWMAVSKNAWFLQHFPSWTSQLPSNKPDFTKQVLSSEKIWNQSITFKLPTQREEILIKLANLASLVCDMNCWLGCRVSAQQSVVAGSISSSGDHGIHCWWDQITSKLLSSVSVCGVYVFAGFSGHGHSIHNIIPLHKKEKCRSLSLPLGS